MKNHGKTRQQCRYRPLLTFTNKLWSQSLHQDILQKRDVFPWYVNTIAGTIWLSVVK